MGAVFFYHLTRTPLEATLPMLLGKARAAGWRVLLRGRDGARMEWLDQQLWLGAGDGFLPHGLAGGARDVAGGGAEGVELLLDVGHHAGDAVLDLGQAVADVVHEDGVEHLRVRGGC